MDFINEKRQLKRGRTLLDVDTGDLFENAEVRTEKQNEAYRYIKQVENERGKEFTFDDMERYRRLMQEIKEGKKNLTDTQLGYWYFIKTFAGHDDFIRASREREPLTKIKEFKELLEVKSRTTVSTNINAMIDNGLLYKEEYTFENGKTKKAFRINSDYSYRGEQKDVRTVKSFNKSIREIYWQNGADALSFLVPLIPFIGLEDNVIVFNPYEKDASKLKPMNIEDIADVTGFSTGKVSSRINSVTYNGMAVFATMIKRRNKMYIVNPLAIYRKQGTPPKSLVRQFQIGNNYN